MQGKQFELPGYVFDYELQTPSWGGRNAPFSQGSRPPAAFCLHKNELIAREDVLNMLWGDDNYFNGRSMDVFVSKLRKHFRVNDHTD
ncbi:MAG: winged helix-turn-helix domain-containing protein [Bacteroidia bacterium]